MHEALPWWLLPLSFGILGACIGSFLNVVIYRVPLGIPINDPSRSFCPECEKPIPWHRNIPIISWVLLRGKSACCQTPISFRYCLVETLTALIFAAMAWKYADASLTATLLLCVWSALAIAIIFIDSEHLIVFRTQPLLAAAAGMAACCAYPFLLPGSDILTWKDALQNSLLGGAVGYAAIRLVIEMGKWLFGSWRQHFDTPAEWSLKEPENDREELKLVIAGTEHDWSILFHRASDKAVITGGSVTIDGKTLPPGGVTLHPDRLEMDNGDAYLLENVKSVCGTLTNIHAKREAMGIGDAWILMMIGSVSGWQGAIFCLSLGSILGIAQALVSRLGFGKNIPFGPALLTAAIIWLMGGDLWWLAYISYLSGQ